MQGLDYVDLLRVWTVRTAGVRIIRIARYSFRIFYNYLKLLSFFQSHHYENTPIQIYWKFYHQKMAIFQIKKSDIFFIFLLKT